MVSKQRRCRDFLKDSRAPFQTFSENIINTWSYARKLAAETRSCGLRRTHEQVCFFYFGQPSGLCGLSISDTASSAVPPPLRTTLHLIAAPPHRAARYQRSQVRCLGTASTPLWHVELRATADPTANSTPHCGLTPLSSALPAYFAYAFQPHLWYYPSSLSRRQRW